MQTELIKKVIITQEKEYKDAFETERIISREVGNEGLLATIKYPNILAILGIRRSGKSFLSLSLLKGRKFGYINFDDERLFGLKSSELDDVLQAFYGLYGYVDYLILDEIQNVVGWELFANRLRRTKKVIITGSNATLLSGDMATKLTGRYLDFILFPFSFSEYLSYHGVVFDKKEIYLTKFAAEIKNHLRSYLEIGGFPEAYKFGYKFTSRIYNDIIEKDVIRKNRIKDPDKVRELAKILVSNFSKEITFRKLREQTRVKNEHTISKYISYLTSSYLLVLINRFSFKLKEQMKAPKKVYCIDSGIINNISFQFSENMGRVMENIVAIELLRSNHYLDSKLELYYWKNIQQQEVDFIIKSGPRVKELLQVCYDIDDLDVKTREVKALLKASKELRCNKLLVVTWDYEGEEKINGKKIKFVPLWKWLLKTQIE